MRIYNTLSGTKEEFVPLRGNKVNMYACGITVSGEAHIGHAYQALIYDIIRKFLIKQGYDVTYARNYTDVDDKIIARAKEAGIPADAYAKMMIKKIDKAMREMAIDDPDIWLKATDNIGNIIDFVSELINKGHAYPTSKGDVYFSVESFAPYGRLSHRNLEDALNGVRIENDDEKKNPLDFALWKSAKEGEICWDSPWGKGRPGWHIECSAISIKNLGEYLDLHCGGIDNAFPHHTNEIAQSEAYLGHAWCPHWFHVLHLNTTDGKMSKSKGEFLTLSLLKEKGYDPAVYRFFCLQSHYRKNLVFSYEGLDNATVAYKKLVERIAALNPQENDVFDENAATALREKFNDGMSNDLNTSLGITCLYDVLKYDTNDKTKRALIEEFDTVLSLNLCKEADALNAKAEEPSSDPDAARIEVLLAERAQAKKDRNFARCDEIRDSLKEEGIVITDTPNGAKWERV